MEELISRIISRYKDATGKIGNMTKREMKLIEISLAESKQPYENKKDLEVKRCPKCNSESVILFDSDNDICNECGNLC